MTVELNGFFSNALPSGGSTGGGGGGGKSGGGKSCWAEKRSKLLFNAGGGRNVDECGEDGGEVMLPATPCLRMRSFPDG